jgi:hypothetical protein
MFVAVSSFEKGRGRRGFKKEFTHAYKKKFTNNYEQNNSTSLLGSCPYRYMPTCFTGLQRCIP